jgi:hypothetical protein
MNLSPDLQEAIAQIGSRQGISPEEFIVQTLAEKIKSLQLPVSNTIIDTSLSTIVR